MIEENEIKVNNWFSHNANWCYRSPAEVKPFLFQWETRDWFALGESTLALDDISPIELSPEILEKLGYEQDAFIPREFNRKGDYNFKAVHHYELGYLIICNFLQGGIMIKYLHQYQNLIYVLIGEELNITL